MNFTTFGGRTFVLTVGAGLISSILVWFGKIDGGAYSTLVIGTVGAYIAATAVQKHAEIRAEVQTTIAAKQAEAPPPTTVEQVPT